MNSVYDLVANYLPGAKVIGSGVEIPDMKWIWKVFGTVITVGS
jgi:hypothetical protein